MLRANKVTLNGLIRALSEFIVFLKRNAGSVLFVIFKYATVTKRTGRLVKGCVTTFGQAEVSQVELVILENYFRHCKIRYRH